MAPGTSCSECASLLPPTAAIASAVAIAGMIVKVFVARLKLVN